MKRIGLSILLAVSFSSAFAQGSKALDVGGKAARGGASLAQTVNREMVHQQTMSVASASVYIKIANLPDSPDGLVVPVRLIRGVRLLSNINTEQVLPARVLEHDAAVKSVLPQGWRGRAVYVPIPWKYSKEKVLYRGITVHHLAELKNILEKGMELSKSHHSGIYATSELSIALWHALPGGGLEPELPVVVKIPQTPELLQVNRPDGIADFLRMFNKDIAASFIPDVMVFCEVNGELGWYKATLHNGEIILQPVFGVTITW